MGWLMCPLWIYVYGHRQETWRGEVHKHDRNDGGADSGFLKRNIRGVVIDILLTDISLYTLRDIPSASFQKVNAHMPQVYVHVSYSE